MPEDESGCECGRTDHTPQCSPYDGNENDSAQFCHECGVCITEGIADSELLIDGASGIYIPPRWANGCADVEGWRGFALTDVEILKDGPEHEEYWDAWDNIVRDAEWIDPKTGHAWKLEQDGDCWAVRYASEGDLPPINLRKLDAFTRGYVDCMLGLTLGAADVELGENWRDDWDRSDIDVEDLRKMAENCRDFQDANREALDATGADDEQPGHDFCLSRNGHGTGFWDRGYPNGNALHAAAEVYGDSALTECDSGPEAGISLL